MEIAKQMTSRALLVAAAAIAVAISIIAVLPAAPAGAQQPEYVIRSTYNNPLPWDDVQRRLNAMFSAVLNYCGGGSLDECLSALHYLNEASQDLERTWIMASVGFFDYDRTAPLGTYGVGLCTDLVTGEDRTIDAVPEGRRWHAWSSGTVCWDRNDDGDFDGAGEIGSLLMDSESLRAVALGWGWRVGGRCARSGLPPPT